MRNNGGNSARVAWLVVVGLLAFMVAFAAGCGGDDDEGDAGGEALERRGSRVRLVWRPEHVFVIQTG